MNNVEATEWLIATLALGNDEVRAVPSSEVVSTHFKAHLEGNRLIVRLPTEGPNGETVFVEYLVTVERVF